MKQPVHRGSIAVIITSLLWSADGLLRRHLYTLPPPVVVFYEHVLGLIVLTPFALKKRQAFLHFSRKQWMAMIGVAFLSGALGTILYTAALGRVQYMPFSVVVLLQQLNPLFAIATATVLLREKLHRSFVIFSIIALVGAYMATFPSLDINFSTGNGTLIAAMYAIGAAAAWGSSTAFSKYSLSGTSFVHTTIIRYFFTTLFALLFVIISGSFGAINSISSEQLRYLILITFSTGLVALLIYYYGLQRITASSSAILELVWPLSSVLIGWFYLHQSLTITQVIGGCLILVSTYFVAKEARDLPIKSNT